MMRFSGVTPNDQGGTAFIFAHNRMRASAGYQMKKTVVFGAGQMGQMIARLLSGDTRLISFMDNNEKIQGSCVNGVPVLKPEEAVAKKPELICLGVLDEVRAGQMKGQLRQLGYQGEILQPSELELFDSRIATMRLLAEEITKKKIPGSVAELGVFRGTFARQINLAFPERDLHLYDTFEGFAEKDVKTETENSFSKAAAGDFSDTSQEAVYESMPLKEKVIMHPGYFPDSFHEGEEQFCFISLDPDLYEPTKAGLEKFWPCLVPGGVIMIHDYNSRQFSGVADATDRFLEHVKDAAAFPVSDVHGSLVLKKIEADPFFR